MTASRGTAAWRSASSRTRQEIEAAGASGVDGFLEAAPFVVAEQRRPVLLGDLLEEDPVRLLRDRDLPFLVHRDLLRVAALRVGGAGDERSEATPAQDHRRAALLAGAVVLRDGRGLGGGGPLCSARFSPVPVAQDDRRDLLGVLALGVA